MSKIPRETIAVVSAIVGANLLAFSLHPKPMRSLDCFQPFQQVGASVNAARTSLPKSSEPRTDIPYYENDPWAKASVQSVAAPVAAPAQPVARNGVSSKHH